MEIRYNPKKILTKDKFDIINNIYRTFFSITK